MRRAPPLLPAIDSTMPMGSSFRAVDGAAGGGAGAGAGSSLGKNPLSTSTALRRGCTATSLLATCLRRLVSVLYPQLFWNKFTIHAATLPFGSQWISAATWVRLPPSIAV